jgi:AraC family transcriptional regulator
MAGAVAASGYATSQAFARALKDRLGVSPGKLSGDADMLAQCKSRLSTPDMNLSGQTPITVEVAALNPLRVLARRNVGDFADLNIGFGLLFEAIGEQLDPGLIRGIYGMPHDDPRFVPAERCRFDCAFDVGTAGRASGAMVELEIAGGRYAGLHHLGDYDDIHERIDGLYMWAIRSGEDIANRPLFIHYLDDPEIVPPGAQRAVIWLPLKEACA